MSKPNLFQIPSYFINMNERKDRLKRFMEQPVSQYMKFRRIRAVNGKAIKQYRTDKRISLRTRFNIYRNYRRSHYEIATLGAVGASLSHFDVWKRFIASGQPYCLVFEDDARVTTDMIHEAHRLWPTIPGEWGIWLLGYYEPNTIKEPLDDQWNRIYNFTAAHAYILKREAAIKLLEDALPIEMHVDHYMSVCATMKGFQIIQHPSINVPFWGVEEGPRLNDSNTSQHKKRGCTACSVPDDNAQLYRRFSMTRKGLVVKGMIKGQQSNKIRTYRNTRKLGRVQIK
jgi:GR25 family glycosyltransferase involved in LPS biosynthesis